MAAGAMRKTLTLALVAVLAVGLSACGRKSRPIEPEGSTYPRRYPDITFPQDKTQQSPDPVAPMPGAGYGTETRTR